MNNNEDKSPMYFASLEIENIKSFGGKQTLQLTDEKGILSPWTLIFGDNGVGKTTLLKCLAWMLPVEETDKEKAKVSNSEVAIKPFMDGFENESDYEELVRIGNNEKATVRSTFTIGVELGNIPSTNQIVSHAINIEIKSGKLDDIELEFGKLSVFNEPNLYAYGASRHMAFKNFDEVELKDNSANLFSNSGDLYDAQQLLTVLDTASLRENGSGKATELLQKVKQLLVDLLPYVKNVESIIINSPLKADGSANDILVEVQTPDGKVPLFNLSLGYVTMLAWSVDLAVRMLWRNPDSEFPLKEPAVVLLDEIDLHLHPKWQRTLKRFLTTHFPRTQFICTAHSPFMAQSSEDENLCVINRVDDSIVIENEPNIVKGWRIGQIITSDLFGLPSERNTDVEDLVERRRKILDKGPLTDEFKKELTMIDDKLSKLPVVDNLDDQKLIEQLRKTAELLKRENKL